MISIDFIGELHSINLFVFSSLKFLSVIKTKVKVMKTDGPATFTMELFMSKYSVIMQRINNEQ